MLKNHQKRNYLTTKNSTTENNFSKFEFSLSRSNSETEESKLLTSTKIKKMFLLDLLRIVVYAITLFSLVTKSTRGLRLTLFLPLFALIIEFYKFDWSEEFSDIVKRLGRFYFDYSSASTIMQIIMFLYYPTVAYLIDKWTEEEETETEPIKIQRKKFTEMKCKDAKPVSRKRRQYQRSNNVPSIDKRLTLAIKKVILKLLLKSSTFAGNICDYVSKICKSTSHSLARIAKVLRHRHLKVVQTIGSNAKVLCHHLNVAQTIGSNVKELIFITQLNEEDLMKPTPDQFHDACAKGHKDVVRQLLSSHKNEIDIFKVEQNSGNTAIHAACSGGHLSVVQQLTSHFGRDLCTQLLNREQKTGLELAVESGRTEVVQEILRTIKRKFIR